jgi:hypothetical protein
VKLRIQIVLLIAVIIVGPMLVKAGSDESALITLIGSETYEDCGLGKLDEEEQERLLHLISRPSATSYLDVSATRYLEKEGWEPISILRLAKSEVTGTQAFRVLARRHGVTYSLRPSIVPHLPDPGLYWAEITGSHWEVLFPDGEDGSFYADQVE